MHSEMRILNLTGQIDTTRYRKVTHLITSEASFAMTLLTPRTSRESPHKARQVELASCRDSPEV